MYPISRHYDKTAKVERMAFVTSSIIMQTLSEVIAAQPCSIQPLSDRDNQDVSGGFGKEYQMFCDVVDIQSGDRITIDDREYRAMGIEKHTFNRRARHMEIRLRIFAND